MMAIELDEKVPAFPSVVRLGVSLGKRFDSSRTEDMRKAFTFGCSLWALGRPGLALNIFQAMAARSWSPKATWAWVFLAAARRAIRLLNGQAPGYSNTEEIQFRKQLSISDESGIEKAIIVSLKNCPLPGSSAPQNERIDSVTMVLLNALYFMEIGYDRVGTLDLPRVVADHLVHLGIEIRQK